MQNPAELTTANFSFSSRPLVGEFLQPTMGLAEAEFVRLGAQEVARRLEELRAAGGFRDIRMNNQYERDKLAYAKKLAKEEAQRHKEQARYTAATKQLQYNFIARSKSTGQNDF